MGPVSLCYGGPFMHCLNRVSHIALMSLHCGPKFREHNAVIFIYFSNVEELTQRKENNRKYFSKAC